MSTQVKMLTIPDCDLCASEGFTREAYADAKLIIGPWAYVCLDHFQQFGCSLGTGRGQKLIQAAKGLDDREDK